MSLLSANLHAFVAVVRQGTVHGAASELRLTQTGVTQRIRALEKELGTTLFLRSRKGMRLTQDGEALLRYCKGAEDLEGEFQSQVGGAAKGRPVYVTLVGPTSVMVSRIVDLCANLYSEWPDLQLSFIISDNRERLNQVRSGQATFAIVPPEEVPNEMDSKRLKPDRYILVASAKWKGRRMSDLLENERVIDFDADDQTTLNYLKKFDLISQLKKPRIFANNNAAIVNLFARGVGFGTLTQEVARPHLESGALVALNGGAIIDDPLALVWYPRPEMPLYFKSIITAIK